MKLLKPFVLSSVVTVAVLYLTLVPQPLPPPDVEIPFADKLVHGLMFAAIAVIYAVDWARHSHRRFVTIKESLTISLISIVFGGVVEFLQWAMNVGRSGDVMDFIADGIGVVIVWLAFLPTRFIQGQNEASGDLKNA